MSADFTHAVLAFGNNLRDEYGFAAAQAKGHEALRAAMHRALDWQWDGDNR